MQGELREKGRRATRVGVWPSLSCSIDALLCEANSRHGNNRDLWFHLGGGKPCMNARTKAHGFAKLPWFLRKLERSLPEPLVHVLELMSDLSQILINLLQLLL